MTWIRSTPPFPKRRTWVEGHVPATFGDLPLEILLEVFHVVDLRSLAALRMSCKYCYYASKMKSVWTYAYQRHAALVCPDRPRILDRPFSDYSSADVEDMVINMAFLEANWASPTPTPRSVRELQLASDVLAIVPGGRWLLTGSRQPQGPILCHDLHNIDRGSQVLVEKHHASDKGEVKRIICSVNGDTAGLLFTLAIRHRAQAFADPDEHPGSLALWTVRYDANQDRLAACHKRSIVMYGRTMNGRLISFWGGQYVRGREIREANPVLEVLHWEQCTETSLKKSIIPLDFRPIDDPYATARLLPGGQVILSKSSVISLYDIPTAQDVPVAEIGRRDGVVPRWTYEYASPTPRGNLAFSAPLPFTENPSRPVIVSVYNSETVYRIAIPEKSDEAPIEVTTFAVGNPKGARIIHVGSRRGFSWRWLDTVGMDQSPPTPLRLISFWPPEEYRSMEEFGLGRLRSVEAPEPPANESVTTKSVYTDPKPGENQHHLWFFDEQSGTIFKRLGCADPIYRIISFA